MGDSYVVKKGDSLSKIGQERWKEIYRENRSKIGDDPNIIKPGQELTVPAEISEAPAPAAPVADEYVEVDPARCVLQSCEIETCDSADTFHMPAYWRLAVNLSIEIGADIVAVDYLSVKEVSDAVRKLFAMSNDPSKSVARNAVWHLKRMAKDGELTSLELKAASRHENPAVRLIAATNARTSLYTLFELAREKDEDGDYTWSANKAVNNIKYRARKGKLSPDSLRIAAKHKNSSLKSVAAINFGTPLETLFDLAKEKDEDGDYTWSANKAVNNIKYRGQEGKLSPDELRIAAGHENPSLRWVAAINRRTPLDALFKLAREKDEDGDYNYYVADKAVNNIERRPLPAEYVKAAAAHERDSLRKMATNLIASK